MLNRESAFRQIETMLRARAHLVERAEEQLSAARDAAYSLPGMSTEGDRVTQSRRPDRIGAKAAAVIEAEEQLRTARAWARLFVEMDQRFPPTGDGPGMIVALHYGSGYSLLRIADMLGITRPTVHKRQQAWLTDAALLAVHHGLIAAPLD